MNAETAEIAKLVESRARARVAVDLAFFERSLHPDYVYVNSWGQVSSKADILARIAARELDFQAQSHSNLEVRVFGQCAVVVALLHDRFVFRGTLMEPTYRVTHVLVKASGEWKFVSGQTTEVSQTS